MNRVQKVIALMAAAMCLFGIQQLFADNIVSYNGTGTQRDTTVYQLDQSGNQTVGGAQTVAGSMTVTGATVMTGKLTANGQVAYGPTIFGTGVIGTSVVLSTVIPVTSSYMIIQASASAIMTALPAISTNVTAGLSGVGGTGGVLPDGTFVTLASTSPTSVVLRFQANGGLTGTLLDFTGAPNGKTTQILTSTAPITFMFNQGTGHWSQVSPYTGF